MRISAITKDLLRHTVGDRVTAYLHGMRFAGLARRTCRNDIEIGIAAMFARDGSTVIDVGANGADWTLAFSRAVGANGSVLAFEAHPYYALATSNALKRLGLDNVELFDLALGESHGQVQLLVGDSSFASFSGRARLVHGESGEGRRVGVDMVTLDSIVDQRSEIDDISLVKLDTEGFELSVLRGGSGTIDRFRPAVITEVGHGWMHDLSDSDLNEFFESRRYRIYALDRSDNQLVALEHVAERMDSLSENRLLIPDDAVWPRDAA